MSADSYSMSFRVRWADLDPNRHLRHTAYNDYATHVRFSYLAEQGFGPDQFRETGLGPVILREETRFLAEVGAQEKITVDFLVTAASPSCDSFSLFHHVRKESGKLAATVLVDGGWLDLNQRKLIAPPPDLAAPILSLPKSEDFRQLEDRFKDD